jgi:hypothetical protein
MALNDFQMALGRCVRVPVGVGHGNGSDAPARERAALGTLVESDGFRFTVAVQRSWCAGRTAKGAQLTLSMLDVHTRRRLIDAWVAGGGGTASLLTAEAEAFLDFIASQLPDPSHALTICRLEQATLRASEGMESRIGVRASASDGMGAGVEALGSACVIRTGRYAGLVRFHADPDRLFAALSDDETLPPVSADAVIDILFAPGLDNLSRAATRDESALWERLQADSAAAATLGALLADGHALETIDTLAAVGALDVEAVLPASLRA